MANGTVKWFNDGKGYADQVRIELSPSDLRRGGIVYRVG
jgi:hypothetical protein